VTLSQLRLESISCDSFFVMEDTMKHGSERKSRKLRPNPIATLQLVVRDVLIALGALCVCVGLWRLDLDLPLFVALVGSGSLALPLLTGR
jgi:hypothetical protein